MEEKNIIQMFEIMIKNVEWIREEIYKIQAELRDLNNKNGK